MNFHQDDQLIKRAQSGDEEAFNALYEKYYKTMLYSAYRFTNNMEDAKDAVQTAFMQMYQSIGNLKDPKYFRLWMNKIVRGKCIDIFHKNRDVPVDTMQDEIVNLYAEDHDDYVPHKRLLRSSDQDIVIHLITELPKHYQEILFYAYYSQFSMKEMANILDIPEGTVKSRLYAAKRSLRDKVMDYEGLHHYKITFHVPGLFSLYLFYAYYKDAHKWMLALTHHKKTKWKTQTKYAFATVGVVTCATVFSMAYLKQSDEQSVHTSLQNQANMSERESYFRLRQWAMDEVQMSEKSADEVETIMPYYEFLKQKQGPYWERIQRDNWDQSFEAVTK